MDQASWLLTRIFPWYHGRMAQRIEHTGLSPESTPTLHEDSDGLALICDDLVLRADFARLLPRLAPSRLQRELLVRSARLKRLDENTPLHAVDATAGLGEDALLLAATGFEIVLCERDDIIAALLEDALARARTHEDERLRNAAARMHLQRADSRDVLAGLEDTPDVVLLDPMFPATTKSARAKKKLQMLQMLERPCEPADEASLLDAALAAHPRKIIVKRPVKGPHLAGRKPDYALAGKAIRFDVIVCPQ